MKTGRRLLRQLKKGECQYVALSQEGGPAASEPVLHSLWVDCPRGPRLEVRGPAHGGRLRGRPRQHTACRLGYELLQNIPLEMEKTSAASFSTISAEGITRGPRSLPTQARAASSTGARQGTVFGPRPALGHRPWRPCGQRRPRGSVRAPPCATAPGGGSVLLVCRYRTVFGLHGQEHL